MGIGPMQIIIIVFKCAKFKNIFMLIKYEIISVNLRFIWNLIRFI